MNDVPSGGAGEKRKASLVEDDDGADQAYSSTSSSRGGGSAPKAPEAKATATASASRSQEPEAADSSDSTDSEDAKPRRPLSAYNIFFRYERARLLNEDTDPSDSDRTAPKSYAPLKKEDIHDLIRSAPLLDLNADQKKKKKKRLHRKTHGKIGFTDLAKHIAKRWRESDPEVKDYFRGLAREDRDRYFRELIKYEEREVRPVVAPPSSVGTVGSGSGTAAMFGPEGGAQGPSAALHQSAGRLFPPPPSLPPSGPPSQFQDQYVQPPQTPHIHHPAHYQGSMPMATSTMQQHHLHHGQQHHHQLGHPMPPGPPHPFYRPMLMPQAAAASLPAMTSAAAASPGDEIQPRGRHPLPSIPLDRDDGGGRPRKDGPSSPPEAKASVDDDVSTDDAPVPLEPIRTTSSGFDDVDIAGMAHALRTMTDRPNNASATVESMMTANATATSSVAMSRGGDGNETEQGTEGSGSLTGDDGSSSQRCRPASRPDMDLIDFLSQLDWRRCGE